MKIVSHHINELTFSNLPSGNDAQNNNYGKKEKNKNCVQ